MARMRLSTTNMFSSKRLLTRKFYENVVPIILQTTKGCVQTISYEVGQCCQMFLIKCIYLEISLFNKNFTFLLIL